MKNMRKEKGITLIALVITIIVMLILVGVTITLATEGGLFEKAAEAATKTEAAMEEEKKLGEGKVNGKEIQVIVDEYVSTSDEGEGEGG